MVPFWVPIIIRGLIRGLIKGTQKGTIILTIPHIDLNSRVFLKFKDKQEFVHERSVDPRQYRYLVDGTGWSSHRFIACQKVYARYPNLGTTLPAWGSVPVGMGQSNVD